ncbi:tripartite motif-containing protein 16 [Paramormyrops kingsleyae]|uniref:tripartite motif-containing protein 16 n=1 Tax=Paramormyrops kingsleyae TaxID=1676925 RepID=UPI003B96A5ED
MSQRNGTGAQEQPGTVGKGRRSSLGHRKAEHAVVLCDFCTGKKRKAVKSCLSCLASYCETHLQPHYEYPAFMKHEIVKATGKIQDKICPRHDKLLEFYCCTDQLCICSLCMMNEHENHKTVHAAVERTEKQKLLGPTLLQSQQKIQGKVKKWQDLNQTVELLKHSAQVALEENERVFTNFIRSIERRHFEVKELIRNQEKAAVSKAEGVLSGLEQEIVEMRRRHSELEQLSQTDDHIHFLQSWQVFGAPSNYEDLFNISINHQVSFVALRKAISDMKMQLEDVCKGEMDKIAARAKEIQIIDTREPKASDDILPYSCQLVLDPNTAHKNLVLSKGNTELMMKSQEQPYPSHPQRFDHWQQVLCLEGLKDGRFYWELDWKGSEVDIAVVYKGISRKGASNNCSFGWNEKSWSLYCSRSKCCFVHDSVSTTLAVPHSPRIGVFLDHRAGILCYYSISDTRNLIHRVQTEFTEPLYPGFGLWGYGSSISLH